MTETRVHYQKLSDHLARLAGKGKITRAALLAGDSDFIPAVEATKREGVLVSLWHGPFSKDTRPSRELYEVCDERHERDATVIRNLLRA